MFKKFATLAVVATVSLAMPTEIDHSGPVPVTADFPVPVVPWDLEATSYTYIYAGGRLAPANEWSMQRWSSSLNRIYEVTGVINDDGDEVPTSIESTDVTAKSAVEYTEGKPCTTASDVQAMNVNQTIATFFEQFSYAGPQFAPWELTRNKYYRLDGKGVQYFYKQSNLQLRFFVEVIDETTSKVHDFQGGLEEKTFTPEDFTITQCTPSATPFLQ